MKLTIMKYVMKYGFLTAGVVVLALAIFFFFWSGQIPNLNTACAVLLFSGFLFVSGSLLLVAHSISQLQKND